MGDILWQPRVGAGGRIALAAFARHSGLDPVDYAALWRWSVDDLSGFWSAVWQDADVVASQGYTEVLTGEAMPGTTWFAGARLNYAENLLRRRGSTPAVIGAGEGMDERVVSRDQLVVLVARAQEGLRELG